MTDKVQIGDNFVEVSWLWRRVLSFLVIAICLAFVGFIVWRLTDATALKWIAMALIGFALIAHLTYLTGATVVDWAKLAASVAQNVGGQLGGMIPGGSAIKAAAAAVAQPAAKVPGDD